ncbi:MAG: hypothetical protein DRJ18_01500 [Candidatus Methanomethylicota archaeon]|nr:MAG: hypothetical protein DRJ18_01500 [Candidatus Verstraetearchaeota archaeon]
MSYCTPDYVRTYILGVDTSLVPDSLLQSYIDEATREVFKCLTGWGIEEIAYRVVGSNIYTWNRPIADANLDGVVDANDVEVYLYTDLDTRTRTQLTVVSVDADRGVITVSESVSSGTVTVTYRYWIQPPDDTLLQRAIGLLAGYFVFLREIALLPSKVSLGTLRIEYPRISSRRPIHELYAEYCRTIELLRGGVARKITSRAVTTLYREKWMELRESEEDEDLI